MDIRWKQRFENMEKAYIRLQEAQARNVTDWLQLAGLIQTFELTFELTWKTLKDYLAAKGETDKYPRDVLKKAFQTGLISNGHVWIEMLDKRNELAHIYDDHQAKAACALIKKNYFPEIEQVYLHLKELP